MLKNCFYFNNTLDLFENNNNTLPDESHQAYCQDISHTCECNHFCVYNGLLHKQKQCSELNNKINYLNLNNCESILMCDKGVPKAVSLKDVQHLCDLRCNNNKNLITYITDKEDVLQSTSDKENGEIDITSISIKLALMLFVLIPLTYKIYMYIENRYQNNGNNDNNINGNNLEMFEVYDNYTEMVEEV